MLGIIFTICTSFAQLDLGCLPNSFWTELKVSEEQHLQVVLQTKYKNLVWAVQKKLEM